MSNHTDTLWTVGPSVDRFVDTDDETGETVVSITHIVVAANARGDRFQHVNGFPLLESQPHPELRASRLADRIRAARKSGLRFSPVNNRYWLPMEPRPGSEAAREQEEIRQREEAEYEIRCQEAEAEAWGQVECHAATWVP